VRVYVVTLDNEFSEVCLTEALAVKAIEDHIGTEYARRPSPEWNYYTRVDLNTGGEPIFVLRGQDKFATGGIKGYQIGLDTWNQTKQADEVQKAMDEMIAWQARHADRIKNPDHQHVPTTGGGA
jgi:hypothetical protein